MKFRNFFLTVSLFTAAMWPTTACVDYDDPGHYNLFRCTDEMPDVDRQRINESAEFWARYTGQELNDDFRYSVENIWESQFDDDNDGNLLITTLRQQGKTDALQLLRLNFDLNQLTQAPFGWDYRKVTPADYNALLTRIDALRLTGDLSHRKTFLKMRCLFALKDYDACMRLWDMFASKWEDSPLKTRMYGYVAGIYFRKNQFEKAMQIYFEQGDEGSIRKCVNRILQTSTLEQEYNKDPNAPILSHFLEDYANYYYHSTFDQFWKSDRKNNPIWDAVDRQREQTLALARRVVNEKKTRDPQMWQAFIGFVQLTQGQNDEAYQSFSQAEQLKAGVLNGRIATYKLAASLRMTQKPAGFDDIMARQIDKDLTAIADLQGPEKDRILLHDLYQYEMRNRLYDYLAQKPHYLSALSDLALSDYNKHLYYHDYELSADDLLALLQDIKSPRNDALTNVLIAHSEITADAVNELLGTRLMKDGKFAEAEPYLAAVDKNYRSTMAIDEYLQLRQLPDVKFMRRDHREFFGQEIYDSAPNVKHNFCLQVLSLQQTIDNSQKEEKAQAALQLANLLFQGSPAGDLWAISEYSWSSAGPYSNEFDNMAVKYLHEAIASSKDPSLLTETYFGLAATPTSNNRPRTIFETGVLSDEDNPDFPDAAEGYRWLLRQTNRNHAVYNTCDWLKLYQPDAVAKR